MTIKLDGMSRKELEKLSRDIEKQIAKLEKDELKAAKEAAEKAAKAHGFTLSDIMGGPATRKTAGKPRTIGEPKYRNPDNESQTWTGKGRQPNWYREGKAAGRPESDFLI